MEVVYLEINKIYSFDKSAATIGAFDGIHLGHIQLINKLKNLNLKKAILTFETHPDYELNKRVNFGYLIDKEDKLETFKELGIDYLFIINKDFLNYSYTEFNKLLHDLNVDTIVCGDDFRYGLKGLGSIKTLINEFNIILEPYKQINNLKLSSEYIRLLISNGQIKEANKYLYKPFKIKGIVTSGHKLGSTLGFKTVNLTLNYNFNNILYGVYSAYIYIQNQKYYGIANYGLHPTVNKLEDPILEVHIFDFNQDIYDIKIEVILHSFIRSEKKFNDIDELKNQIEKDIELCKYVLSEQ